MIKPKLNVFFRVFLVSVFLLNLCGVLFFSFVHYQNFENKKEDIKNKIASHIIGLKNYYHSYEVNQDSLKTNDIEKFSKNVSDFITGDFLIVKKIGKIVKQIYSSPGELAELKIDNTQKYITNRSIDEQLKEQYAMDTEIKHFSTLLIESGNAKLFLIYVLRDNKFKWLDFSIIEIVFFEILIMLISLFIASIAKHMFSKFGEQINSTVYHVLNGSYSKRLSFNNIVDLDKINSNINLLLEKLEEYQGFYSTYEKNKDEITHLLNVVNRAADGDFMVKAEISEGILGYLSDSFNLMLVELGKLFLDVKTAAEQITSFTKNIIQNAEIFTESTELQTKKIETILKLSEEMANQLDSSFKNAQSAQNAISITTQVAKKGSSAINNSLEQTHQLKVTIQNTIRNVMSLAENSKEIQDILDVSNDFTSRTNLLALNATIEASRGGEGNKGLAYIADEIRLLAEKSKFAAKDIQTLLENIQNGTEHTISAIKSGSEEVNQGAKLVDESGQAFNEIVEMVNKTSHMIKEMVISIEVQAKQSNEVFEAMAYLANIAQSGAKGVAETSRLSFQMEALSQNLMKAVSKFKIRETNFGVIR
ncbi:MAG: methyl-accepting chemotaxis protein [Calditrichia bacterium]|nr:methyl-accepting chemotaxis protein [Calditrichia bacterium]